ncbi:phosphopentomutase isoform X2 [Anabrus simplex]|uniref:phosphopentomutase isoform X2 n=1 Tax=Anabrus simplex TaxID=316456 RepID=UPI0035A2AFEF
MSDTLELKIEEWLNWDKNEHTIREITALRDEGNTVLLEKLLMSRLEFGTAGLRGRMGPGYSQMNDLVIVQTSQGLASYVDEVFGSDAEELGVVVGYDGRYNSKRFAELTAAIFINKGIPVYLYSQVCPTPFVPFALLHFKCVCGVMVTASHNPKDDNGYKVYWNNGAQIIPPHDKNIQEAIMKNLAPLDCSWDTSIIDHSNLLNDPLPAVMDAYYSIIQDCILYPNINANTPVKFTYTPMHGVGYPYMLQAFNIANFKPFVVVEEQKDPDPEFSTVEFPNPEEGKSSLELAIKTANENQCTVILANDPDADRLAVAEKSKTGDWRVFSGNEVGALLGWWCLYCYREKNPDADLSDVYMMSSTVSSMILKSMSKVEGFKFLETLTGFKWMGNKSHELISEGKTVLFAFEEAIGFMCGTAVLDKDGVSAAVQTAGLVAYLKTKGLSLTDKLNEIYLKYGRHITLNSYYFCHDQTVLKKIFERLRNFKGTPKTYPDGIIEGKYKIVGIRDLTNGFDSTQPDQKAILPVSSSSQMVTFTFNNGLVATLRTSGTEPKIKYYTELCASPEEQNEEVLSTTLNEMVEAIVQEFLQPEVNGLIPRSS